MQMTLSEQDTFREAVEALRTYGTGTFRKDLPKALELVAAAAQDTGITPLHGLVIGAAARRLDEIAKELGNGFLGAGVQYAELGTALREYRHKAGG